MRSKLLFLMLLAVGIVVIGSSVQAQNLLLNPGFEDTTGTEADNWVHWGWNDGASTIESDPAIQLSGNYLQCTTGTSGGSGVYQNFEAELGGLYAISAWAKTTDPCSRATLLLIVIDDLYVGGSDVTELVRNEIDMTGSGWAGEGTWHALPDWTYGEFEYQILSEDFTRADPTISGQLLIKIEVANNTGIGGTTTYFDNISGYVGGLPDKWVSNPNPYDGEPSVSPSTKVLSWERLVDCPDANSMVELWWGSRDDPNFWGFTNSQGELVGGGEPAMIMALADTDSFNLDNAIGGAISLNPAEYYYWALKYQDPNGFACTWGINTLGEGPTWSFDTINRPPVVDAGLNVSKWMASGDPPIKIGLDATVTDDGLPLGGNVTHTWTTTADPCDIEFTSTNDDGVTSYVQDPNVIITAAGDYKLTLTVHDGYLHPEDETGEDSVLIRVFINSDDRLVAHWPLDEESGDPCDIVGGHNGSLVGAPTQNVDGQVDKAILLDGVDDYITIPDTGTPDPNVVETTGGAHSTHSWENKIEDGITVSAWMKLDEDGWSDDWETIVAKSNHGWQIQRAGGDSDSVRFVIRGQSDDPCDPSIFNSGETFATSDTAYFDVTSGWHQLVGTFDGNKVDLYIDGMPAGPSNTSFEKIAMDPSPITIGASTGIGSDADGVTPWNEDRSTWTLAANTFGGTIDQVKIFDAPVPHWAQEDGTPGIVEMFRTDGGHNSCGGVYLVGDQNEDCYITLADFAVVANDWVECNDIANVDCD